MKEYFVITDVHSFYSIMMDELIKKGFDINNKDHILISCGDNFNSLAKFLIRVLIMSSPIDMFLGPKKLTPSPVVFFPVLNSEKVLKYEVVSLFRNSARSGLPLSSLSHLLLRSTIQR